MLNVLHHGAVGDGIVDDTAAIQALVNLSPKGSTILFPSGVYKISSEIAVANKSAFGFIGHGATIKGASSAFRSYFHVSASNGIAFEGFTFDQMKSTLPRYTQADYAANPNMLNCPIFFEAGSFGLTVRDCAFVDLYTVGVFCWNAGDILIESCSFRSPVQNQNLMLQHVHAQTCAGMLTIRDSDFINAPAASPDALACGIFVSGHTGSSLIENNRFDYCGRNNAGTHRLGVIDFYADAVNVRVQNNVSTNGMAQFMRLAAIRNGIVQGNRIHLNPLAELDYSTLTIESVPLLDGNVPIPGVQQGAQDVQILDNVFEDPAQRAAFTIGVLSYHWDYPSTNVRVAGNGFSGSRRAVYAAGPFSDLVIEGNEMRDHVGSIEVVHNGANAAAMRGGNEASSGFRNLAIRNNVMRDVSGGGSNAVTIALAKAPPFTGSVERMVVEGNSFHAASANPGQAIAAIFNDSRFQSRLEIRRNETRNYNYDWYVRSTREVTVEGNRAIATGSAAYLDDGSNGTVLRRGNRLTTGPCSGTVSLAGGSATVSTPEIRTGDVVVVSRIAAGGTPGQLSIGAISDKTSFAINSTSATDASSVFWEIMH